MANNQNVIDLFVRFLNYCGTRALGGLVCDGKDDAVVGMLKTGDGHPAVKCSEVAA